MTWKYICLLEIWITWFQKELATPRFKIPHMNYKKEILVPFRKILVPFRTTKDCHSCWSLFLVWQICSLNWDLYINSFVEILSICFGGPLSKYLQLLQRSWVQILGVNCNIFSCWHPWETRFKSGFHSSFWDFKCRIWKWGMASSFWNHVIQISIRQVHFQGIHSQLWIVKIFSENIYFL